MPEYPTPAFISKTPVNETLRGVLEPEFDISDSMQPELNPRGVNVIRQFPGPGVRIWGARTMSSDPLWKFVRVRCFSAFPEQSIYEETGWLEPYTCSCASTTERCN
jgi:phage tail sheath protein FI